MPPKPEKKIFFAAPLQDEDISRNDPSNDKEEPELKIEPSEVTEIIPKCCEFDNQIKLLSEAYHLVYGGPTNLLNDSTNLTEIKTPMNNTVLHIASLYGNDEIVTLIIEHSPKLLFKFNKNNDSVLHVAARGGHISTVKILLASYANFKKTDIATAWLEYTEDGDLEDYDAMSNMKDLLKFVKKENIQGNTMFHEAMLCGDKKSIDKYNNIFKICEVYYTNDRFGKSLSKCCYEYALNIVNHAKKSVLYIAVENGDQDAVKLILEKCPKNDAKPEGLSPVVAAIMKHNQEILNLILKNKPTWIHSRDKHERLPLHYAASIGYLEGVDLLLMKCKCCTIQRDKYGYFPIHLASYGGHVEVVNKFLEYCPDPTEMLDTSHRRNILHIASNHGKHEVVCYILQSDQVRKLDKNHKMINQKDSEGNTPLHLAAKSCHPKTVFYLTWDQRVDLDVTNQNSETPLDVINATSQLRNPSTRQQLTRVALNSAGAKPSDTTDSPKLIKQSNEKKESETEVHKELISDSKKSNESIEKSNESNENVSNTPQYFFLTGSNTHYKDRVETLTLVSTLIITASVAACFAVPGEAEGKAHNLYHAMFQLFIFFITISLFSSISSTIMLFWATLGLTRLATFSLKIVMPLLGIALISLTLAFMAGLYTVIGKLTWLATLFLVVSVIFVVLVILLYIVLFLPSSSSRKFFRYISYYPFLFLAWLAE